VSLEVTVRVRLMKERTVLVVVTGTILSRRRRQVLVVARKEVTVVQHAHPAHGHNGSSGRLGGMV
jgi:hypothetical protein